MLLNPRCCRIEADQSRTEGGEESASVSVNAMPPPPLLPYVAAIAGGGGGGNGGSGSIEG